MDIRATMEREPLRSPCSEKKKEILSAKDVGRLVTKSFSKRKAWLKDRVSSKEFVLATVAISAVAIVDNEDIDISASIDEKPLIIDVNKNKVGRTPSGYVPRVIVIEGAARHTAARYRGKATVKAWVGMEAAKLLNIQADHQFGSQELQQKLAEQLREKLVPKRKDGTLSDAPYPYVKEVYPFESYFIYSFDSKLYKQGFTFNDKKRSVAFDGDPEEVVQKYVDLGATGMAPQTSMDKAMQLNPIGNQPKMMGGKYIANATAPGTGVGPRVDRKPIFGGK